MSFDFPNIISAASQSNLGILALAVLVISVIGVIFFRFAPSNIKLLIFALMFTGVCSLGFGILTQVQSEPSPLWVSLAPNNKSETLQDIVSCKYSYDELTDPVKTHSGNAEITYGENPGTWMAKLPAEVLDKAIELTVHDKDGRQWQVKRFYPNRNKQEYWRSTSSTQVSLLDSEMTGSIPTLFAENVAMAAPPSRSQKTSQIKFNNYARLDPSYGVGTRRYYNWRVFVDEPFDVLNNIAEVEYVLHPTFYDPIQSRTNASDKFALETTGWGTFTILITIRFKDQSNIKTSYTLSFEKPWPDEVGK